MPSKAELLEYFQKELEKNRYKSQNYGDRLLSPEVRGQQNSISQPGPGVEDLGVGEKLAMGGMALSNLPMTGASILLQKLQDHLFPDEPSLTDSLIPDPLTGELKPTAKTASLSTRSPKFRGKMGENVAKNSHLPPNIREALSFLETRYPTITKKFKVLPEKPENQLGFQPGATYNPRTDEIKINPEAYPTAPNSVNALSHELSHGLREKRLAKNPEYRPGTQYVENMRNRFSYPENPEEIAARQGGRTGELNYLNFADIPNKEELMQKIKQELQDEFLKRRVVKQRSLETGERTNRLGPFNGVSPVRGANDSTIKNMGNIGGELWRKLLESTK